MTNDRDRKLAEARAHATVVATGLAATLGPIDAAGVLIGAGVGVLTSTYGAQKAAEYLDELAVELEVDEDDDETPPPIVA